MWLRRVQTSVVAVALAVGVEGAAPNVSAADDIVTVAGTGAAGFGGDGGPASRARLNLPRGLEALPGGGYLIVEAFGHRVRRVSASGVITTVAGTGSAGFSGDGGRATAARLDTPHAVAALPGGAFLIADLNNQRIRRVSADGVISTVAGTGAKGYSGDGGPARSARLSGPRGVASFSDGSYLITDSDNNRIRRVSAGGTITTVAGTNVKGFSGDGGLATSARIDHPFGTAPLPDGGFLIADTGNHRVRQVSASGVITTVAGVGGPPGTTAFSGDGGPATAAQIAPPFNVTALPEGGFLTADSANNRVRKVSSEGIITTVAGNGMAGFSGDGGPPTAARLKGPKAMLPVRGGFLVADSDNQRVRRVRSGCADRTRPVSFYSRASRAARRGRRFTLRGSASDRGCGVARVQVSFARVQGRGRCRHLRGNGRLGSITSCARPAFLRARLARSGWSFSVRRSLPRGTYVVRTRAIDRSQNGERRRTRGSRRNVIRITVN